MYAPVSHGNHVPATEAANNARFLRNDNSWQTVTPANIGAAASDHSHGFTIVSGSTAFSVASGFTLSAAHLRYNGFVACFTANIKTNNALTAGTTYTLGNIATAYSGYKPPYYITCPDGGGLHGIITLRNDGVLRFKPWVAVAKETTLIFGSPLYPH